jgi:peptidoglycan/LPS O-acetylase OafA/YrhL
MAEWRYSVALKIMKFCGFFLISFICVLFVKYAPGTIHEKIDTVLWSLLFGALLYFFVWFSEENKIRLAAILFLIGFCAVQLGVRWFLSNAIPDWDNIITQIAGAFVSFIVGGLLAAALDDL